MKKLKAIMFVGTGSDVGKSVINAAFCRIFLQDGYRPAPYKAQNMSLNSYATPDGLEIGRAQAVQAEACGIPCQTNMNPVLLKPNNYTNSQVIINGKVSGNQSAKEYFDKNKRADLFPIVCKAFNELEKEYNPIVMEGAGSISEINLKDRDITNMRIAMYANAAVYLIADIDRGGVFGSVYGTIMLLPENERKLVKGIIINKFRGDISLFEDGAKKLEDLTGIPVVAIVPYYNHIQIDDEDSVVLDKKQTSANHSKINIAVVLLRHMSNFTDFNILEKDERCHLYYATNPNDLDDADIIILPGSKNTIDDLLDLRKRGFAQKIKLQKDAGKTVIGICGGYQMLGKSIHDPYHMESNVENVPGLDLLPVETTITKEKTTIQCEFKHHNIETLNRGYEIHMGETKFLDKNGKAVNIKTDGSSDGCFADETCWGTYIHGIFDNPVINNQLLKPFSGKNNFKDFDPLTFKEKQYNALADHVRNNANMDLIYEHISTENA
ncbi:MAG: cobyric acid synthase [Bacteroidales bacterium]|nr:cobyric acid synthase [Bacteroidales bacterium]